MESVETLNRRLIERYGKDITSDRPFYRLVWSTSQTEVRRGDYNVFYGSIYLRTEKNHVKEVPKYPFDKDRWVLERLTFGISTRELVNAFNGSYEPIWVFKDKEGNYLPPIWLAIEFIISAAEGRVSQSMTPSDLEEEKQKELAAEIQYFESQLENEAPLFADKAAVALNHENFARK